MGFTSLFGGTAVKPSQVAYEALTITANTNLFWPTESTQGVPYVATQMDITASSGGLSLIMPSAQLSALGQATVITNVGSNSFTLTGNTGVPIVVIAASVSWLISLTTNATVAGTWRALQLGATTSNAQASTLADNETLQANGTQLQVFVPTNYLTVNTTLTNAFRGSLNVWQSGSPPGTLQLDSLTNLNVPTAGWFCYVMNEALNTVSITTTGGATINNGASLNLLPSNGVMIVASASGFNAFYLPSAPASQISTFNNLGTVSAGGSHTINLTTTAAVPTAGLIVVGVMDFNTSQTAAAVTDSVGNSYSRIATVSPNGSSTNGFAQLYYCFNAIALPVGGTITFTNTAATSSIDVSAGYATGALSSSDPLDTHATASGSSATASVTAAATVANELFIGWGGTNGGYPFILPSGWSTPLNGQGATSGASGGNLRNINATTQTYNPALTTSDPWGVIIASFKPGF